MRTTFGYSYPVIFWGFIMPILVAGLALVQLYVGPSSPR